MFEIYLKQEFCAKSPLSADQIISLQIGGLTLNFQIQSWKEDLSEQNDTIENAESSEDQIGLVITNSVQLKINDQSSILNEESVDASDLRDSMVVELPEVHGKLDQLLGYFLSSLKSELTLKKILVSGSAKSGKTSTVNWICNKYASLFIIKKLDQNLHIKSVLLNLSELDTKKPFLLLVDNLHKLSENEINELESLMEKIGKKNGMLICFTDTTTTKKTNTDSSNNSEKLESLKTRFDKEIVLGHISGTHRIEIIDTFLHRVGVEIDEPIKDLILQKTSSMGLGEMLDVIRELKFRKHLSAKNDSSQSSLLMREVKSIFREMAPAKFKQFSVETSDTKWTHIGGYSGVKKRIQTIVELANKSPDIFFKRGILPSRGLLLYGPPGCSKTMFARAISSESNLAFLSVSGPEIFGKYVGQSEKKIRQLFQSARLAAPCVVFFDEIDAIATSRGGKSTGVHDRVLMQLLTEMDGVGSNDGKDVLEAFQKIQKFPNDATLTKEYTKSLESFSQNRVIVIAATNRPDVLDKAIIRPGRFDELVYVGLPDDEARAEILRIHMKGMQTSEDVQIEWMVAQSKGYTGAEINQVIREAAMQSILEEAGVEKVSTSSSLLFTEDVKKESLFVKNSDQENKNEKGCKILLKINFKIKKAMHFWFRKLILIGPSLESNQGLHKIKLILIFDSNKISNLVLKSSN